jgi:hypothetical protein
MIELTLSNWKDEPPYPWTLRVERRWFLWRWSLSDKDAKEIACGYGVTESGAYRRGSRLLSYAISV